MAKKQDIRMDWLTQRTGDPFADIGGMVLKILMRKNKQDDILELIEDTAKLYVNDWKAKLHAFFLNSTITQAAYKGDRKIVETENFFKALLEDRLPFEEGYCRILGERTKVFTGGRDNHILSGSGTFINFHHAFQGGVMLSKEALIRMFFVPMGCMQLGDKIALLYSNDEELVEFFVGENVMENSRQIASRITDGIHRSNFKNPGSALFDFALRWIRRANKSEMENIELNLYHFTNFGASPEIVLYNFSASLFSFYAQVQHRTLSADWNRFAHAYFYQKNAVYLPDSGTFEFRVKKEVEILQYEDFKVWRNGIYERLLNDKSILKAMLKWVSEKEYGLVFDIVKLYQITLRNMNEKTLKIIERIADYVLEDSANIKKHLRNLQKPTQAYAFRNALQRLARKNLGEKNPQPLFTLDEYALELFPDGTYWQEIQDLLLIAIYQKMHEQQIWMDDEDQLVEETETENS